MNFFEHFYSFWFFSLSTSLLYLIQIILQIYMPIYLANNYYSLLTPITFTIFAQNIKYPVHVLYIHYKIFHLYHFFSVLQLPFSHSNVVSIFYLRLEVTSSFTGTKCTENIKRKHLQSTLYNIHGLKMQYILYIMFLQQDILNQHCQLKESTV